ncbi:MAG TPA: SusD/RagB family nutrient-binding outer membrane lipoprotein [Bacteroidia bacterium]|jgi:hypothetical protein|nr:SusD/RagB family nutrient-binding outer membrane lipoprotein [Bacteroidia bacterium]
MKTMKKISLYISAIAVAGVLLFATSCKKDFYTKANVNPNQPSNVPPNTLLPGIEVSLAYAQGGDASRYASEFIQQGYGAAREAASDYSYEITGTNLPEQLWDNMYAADMENDYTLLNMANSNGYNEYAGIANILMAYSLQVTVDFWGSVPYSQAFQGAANINPAYDPDQTIYGDIITLLNTGISDLQKPNPGVLVPTTDDVIYGGKAASWIAFANAIKARIYIHQCKHSTPAMCTNAFAAADSALSEGFSNAQVTFPGVPNSNPNYQYIAGWGDITYVTSGGVHATMYDTMVAISDPRIPVYFDSTGAATASTPIVGMNTATSYYAQPTSPVELITKEELDFIEAEATLRSGGTVAAAEVYYANAINDNFAKLGIGSSAAAYIVANPLPATNAQAQYVLGKQEWIALFMNPEAWACWRRTGAPSLIPVVAGDQVPRRMVLPNSEITENSNAPQGETLWSPLIFWDK